MDPTSSTLIVGLKMFVNLRCLLFSLGIPGFCGRWQFFSLHLLLILFKEIPSLHGCSDGPSRSTAVHNPGKISSLGFCERYLTVILTRAIQFWLLFAPSFQSLEGSSLFLFYEQQRCAGNTWRPEVIQNILPKKNLAEDRLRFSPFNSSKKG